MELGELSTYVLTFVIVAVIIGIGATILTQVMSTQCTSTAGWNSTAGVCGTAGSSYNTSTLASNATAQGLSGINTFGTWLPTIAVILAAAVVIGVIIHYFRQ